MTVDQPARREFGASFHLYDLVTLIVFDFRIESLVVIALMMVVFQILVVVYPPDVQDDIARLQDGRIAGANDGGVAVEGDLTKEPDAEGFVGLEGSGVCADGFGGGWVGGEFGSFGGVIDDVRFVVAGHFQGGAAEIIFVDGFRCL